MAGQRFSGGWRRRAGWRGWLPGALVLVALLLAGLPRPVTATAVSWGSTVVAGPDDLADPLGFIEGNVGELEFEVPDDIAELDDLGGDDSPSEAPEA